MDGMDSKDGRDGRDGRQGMEICALHESMVKKLDEIAKISSKILDALQGEIGKPNGIVLRLDDVGKRVGRLEENRQAMVGGFWSLVLKVVGYLVIGFLGGIVGTKV